MIELTNKLRAGAVDASSALPLTLTFDERQKSRLKTQLDSGEPAWVILAGASRGGVLRDGDLLKATDGRIVRVVARPEPVMQARPVPGAHALTLARAAYHLGNRHAHVQLGSDAHGPFVRCEPDTVYRDMLTGLGLQVEACVCAFEPEAGAYAAGHTHHADGARHAGRIHDHNTGALQYAHNAADAPTHDDAHPRHSHGPHGHHGH